LSPSRPVVLDKKKVSKDKKRDRRKSKGVSLQGGGMTMSILELLQHIVNEPAPKLTPEGRFPKEAEDFVNSCLLKEPDHRRTPKDLLVSDPVGLPKCINLGRVLLTEPRVDQTCADSTL
jgi:mitogen-activated protein kinase kinase